MDAPEEGKEVPLVNKNTGELTRHPLHPSFYDQAKEAMTMDQTSQAQLEVKRRQMSNEK